VDQVGWHLAGQLVMLANTRLLFLSPYSPELISAEHLQEALRENYFANHVFADLGAVESSLS
jgi:transposase